MERRKERKEWRGREGRNEMRDGGEGTEKAVRKLESV